MPGLPRGLRRPGRLGAGTEILDGEESTAGLEIVGDDMPRATNRDTLDTDAPDQHVLPVPDVDFDDHPDDVVMREYAWGARPTSTARSGRPA